MYPRAQAPCAVHLLDYRALGFPHTHGQRVDLEYADAAFAAAVTDAYVDRDLREDTGASDHGADGTPVYGTFTNVRLRNQLAPGTEGGVTRHLPDGQTMPIFDAATRYAADKVPLVIVAGAEYGSGSSRDWTAKGTLLLGSRPCWRPRSNASTAPTSSAWGCCLRSSQPRSPLRASG